MEEEVFEEFEVVDECIDDDEVMIIKELSESASNVPSVQIEKIDKDNDSVAKKLKTDNPKELTENQESGTQNSTNADKKQNSSKMPITNVKDPQEKKVAIQKPESFKDANACGQKKKSDENPDDISLDRSAVGEYMTDEEILNHLDEIENIDLDGSGLVIQDDSNQNNVNDKLRNETAAETPLKETSSNTSPKKPSAETKTSNSDENKKGNKIDSKNTKVEEKSSASDITTNKNWYEKKLEGKVATVKERLSKLARVLEFSYPRYKNWLDRNEVVTKTPVCQLDPPRRCSLDKPYTNRWKFICNRKPVQEASEKQNVQSTDNTDDSTSTMWQLTPTGVWGSNTDNASEYPPFVMKAVKVFEDFLQTTCHHREESSAKPAKDVSDPKDESISDKSAASNDTDEKDNAPQQWLWLLVRCNSMDELMLFATGKNIDRATMDILKQTYENGAGKDCNVKSLYCKSITKVDGTIKTSTTFLVGSEALDEVVGGIKIQLAPKTNFWSNAAGAETLANAVADLLSPTPKTTVVEIGCGTGLIGLMLASKCHQVIGLDSPSEVEEAEMTSELNGVKNASFVMGQPTEVMATIAQVLSNCKAAAIVNTNTNIGRAIEVMTYVRKISSLRRLVLVTTLTKQSVRAILELTRPADSMLGNPFVPIRACVVDTLPIGPHFEVVVLMERRMMNKFPHHWVKTPAIPTLAKPVSPSNKTIDTPSSHNTNNLNKKDKSAANKTEKNQISPTVELEPSSSKETLAKKGKVKIIPNANKKPQLSPDIKKGPKNVPVNKVNKFKSKRLHSPERPHIPPKKIATRFDKPNFKPWKSGGLSPPYKMREDKRFMSRLDNPLHRRMNNRSRSPISMRNIPERGRHHRSWSEESVMPHSPVREKKFRESKDTSDLRERLSSNRIEPELMENVKKQQQMLDLAKQKLNGPSPAVDVATAKQLQNMLNMVLEQTNKLQSQLPRSVWDRIAPPENVSGPSQPPSHVDPLLKGRYVQEMGTQDILITTANREFLKPADPPTRGNFDRYNNSPGSRNSLISPNIRQDSTTGRFENIMTDRYRSNINYSKQESNNEWNRDKLLEKNRWNPFQTFKKTSSPTRKPVSPIRHHIAPGRRLPSPRRNLSPMRRLASPPRHMTVPQKRRLSPPRRQMSPPRRQMSPLRRQMSPPRRILSPGRPQIPPIRRQNSPPRRQLSPPLRRPMSPPLRRPMSPVRRAISPPRLLSSPSRRPVSPPRRLMSPPRRTTTADDWDMPNRGAAEQSTWQRPNERVPEKRWHDERQQSTLSNWENPSNNERYRKAVNPDKWDIKEASHEVKWTNSSSGGTWDPKPSSSVAKEHWQSNSENRWQSSSGGPNGDNWNIRSKETSSKPSLREETNNSSWMDNNKLRWESGSSVKDSWGPTDKEDWNDLPDDAKDPWGDEGNSAIKDRWPKYDNAGTSSGVWSRDNQQGGGDTWNKPSDNWQNKSTLGNNKSQWQSSTNIQPSVESRWSVNNSAKKSVLSGNWSSGSNTNNWQQQPQQQQQNYSGFQQPRSYISGPFKDRR